MKTTDRGRRVWRPAVYSVLALLLVASAVAEPPDNAVPQTLVFAGSADYPPFQWLDADGRARGFVVDLQEAIAAEDGRRAEHRLTAWQEALRAVETGQADVVALFPSEERRENFMFSEPFYYVAHAIFSRSGGEDFGRLEELAGHTVAVVAGAYAEEQLTGNSQSISLIRAPNERACLEFVAAGKAAACVEAAHTARRNAADADLAVHQTSAPFWPRPYVFGVRQGETRMLEWLNHQLALVQVDGHYHRIYNAWLPQLEWHERTLTDTLRQLTWLILPLLLLATAGYFWSWSLRRQVAQKTRHLATELNRRERLQDELEYRARHDTLTGLYNRAGFVEELKKRIETRPDWKPSVIVLRMVNREQLITTFSYGVIQDLMKAFAQRLKELDFQLVGHFGSGLFAVIPNRPTGGDEIIRLLNDPLELDSIVLDPQMVVGIVERAVTDGDPKIVDELIRRSVTAISAAANKGLPWLIYSDELEPDAADLLLLQDFHRYGSRDMFLEYQPKVNLKHWRIAGAEALVRWRHPKLGVLPPGRFIPLLEQSGLIHRLTYWVTEEAVGLVNRFGLCDSGFDISINMAPQDLLEDNLVTYVSGAVREMKQRCLQLEITETGFISDPLILREVLTGLREAGTQCAVDDFGTGYSSLYYLSEFPVDEVKLDRHFVGDMLENPYHQVIVRSTITLAHELGLTVTAEGVEDARTLRALVRMECDAAQGFLISRPVSEEQLRGMLGQEVDQVSGQPLLGGH